MTSKEYLDPRNSEIVAAINRLHDVLIPKCGGIKNIPARRKISIFSDESPSIYLLVKGEVTVYRRTNGIGVAMAISPSVLGIAHAHAIFYGINFNQHTDSFYSYEYYAYTESECSYYKCPLSVFVEEVEDANLWHDIARVLAGVIHTLSQRDSYLSSGDAYHTIRLLLIELYKLPHAIRNKINAQKFIQSRTGLSRSRIMSILAELKRGGYIIIERGTLIEIIELPNAF